jgi:hypothetical protein
MKKTSKYPVKCSDTNEIVYNYDQYIQTEHFKNLKKKYNESGLSKLCQKCNNNISYDFYHRTYKRLGHEYLIDIIPLCKNCHEESKNIFNIRKKGKKKILRKLLYPYCFDPTRMAKEELNKFLEIPPKSRGCVLSQYFSAQTKGLHASQQWINQQVANVCKWIRNENMQSQKNIKNVTFDMEDLV